MPTPSRFAIQGREFYLDGAPFKIISGTLHYFRVEPGCWLDRLQKLRAMGCNTVETYIPWNLHEPQPGVYDFTGGRDVAAFLRTAQAVGLYAIVRPSPFICAEWEFGGQPAWLLAQQPPVPVRCKAGPFLQLMDRFYAALFPQLAPLQIDNGGPIILMQTENEYGAFGDDAQYLQQMDAMMRAHGATVPFITCNNFEQDITRGTYPGALITANFGSGAREKFAALAQVNGGGPLLCTEFWIGWYDAWGDAAHHTTAAEAAAAELDALLELGNVNIYMAHGGTNFGFMNGANYYAQLTPDVTSYDYDAPIAEDGALTPKYYRFREVIGKYAPLPPLPADLAAPPRRAAYGPLPVQAHAPLLGPVAAALGTAHPLARPAAMETLGQSYGYTLYTHTLAGAITALDLGDARDRVQIFADGEPVLTLFDAEILGCHPLALPAGATLQILVENMGRVNYGPHLRDQRKGLLGPVRATGAGGTVCELTGWQATCLPLENLQPLAALWQPGGGAGAAPAFFRFCVNVAGTPADTYLDFAGWGKGCAFVNGFNLGRYWAKGPQRRLYLPAPLLHPGENEIVLLETEGVHADHITLAGEPDLGNEE